MKVMNERLCKEAREQWLSLLGALALIETPYVIWGRRIEDFGVSALGLGCMILAAGAFGHEFQYRTTTLLLAQPIARRVFWRDKLLVLGVALVLSTLLLWWNLHHLRISFSGVALVLTPLCAFCGGPWLTLQLRSGIAGAVSTAIIPGALTATIVLIMNHWQCRDELITRVVIVSLFVYCAAAYCLGYVTFRRFQVVEGASRELTLPIGLEARLSRVLGGLSGRFSGPVATLVKKELRLHQIAFLAAGISGFVFIVGALLHLYKTDWSETIIAISAAIYLPVLPFLVGGMSTAEERGWGISQWHLSLPPSMARQWGVKSLVALSVSCLLGVVLPAAIYLAAAAIAGQELHEFFHTLPALALGQLLLMSAASYAGTFSTSTLRAILLAFGIVLAFGCWVRFVVLMLSYLPLWLVAPNIGDHEVFRLLCLGMFLLLVLLQGFAFVNFKRGELPVRRFLFQFGTVLGVAAVFMCAAVISYSIAHPMF
jgi:hypothetical protein